ncbi:MAG: hypothetical protein EXR08_04710 [Alphaproteobacteria bacterium]|nr:hypothetical protein [Alphaproteobacteria bacterium]
MKTKEKLQVEEIEQVPPDQLSSLISSYWRDGAVKIEIVRGNETEGLHLRVFFPWQSALPLA